MDYSIIYEWDESTMAMPNFRVTSDNQELLRKLAQSLGDYVTPHRGTADARINTIPGAVCIYLRKELFGSDAFVGVVKKHIEGFMKE